MRHNQHNTKRNSVGSMDYIIQKSTVIPFIFNDLGLHGICSNFDKKDVINSALRWLISYAEKGGNYTLRP